MFTQFSQKIVVFTAILALASTATGSVLASTRVDVDTNEKNYAPAVTSWKEYGNADSFSDGRIRVSEDKKHEGHAYTDVKVKSSQEGDYALFVAFTRAEQVHPDLKNGDPNIAGLPYLYAYFLNEDDKIKSYAQGDEMIHDADHGTRWSVTYGVYKIPNDTEQIRFFAKQASRKGTDQDGRDAWFYEPGLFIVDDREDAFDIVDAYRDELDDVADYFSGRAEPADDDWDDEDEDEDDDQDSDYAEGTLLKCSGDADVYSMLSNNTLKRYPDEDTFYAWGKSFADVKNISCSKLDDYRVSGTWSYTRADYLVKFRGFPQIYTLDNGSYLRHIPDEHTARAMFGRNWQNLVREYSASHIGDYHYSAPHSLR